MQNNYGVSVIIPTCKQKQWYLEMAIASVLDQTFWFNNSKNTGEIIVVEDGFSDNYFRSCVEISKSLGLEFCSSSDENIQTFTSFNGQIVKFILREENGGTAAALNTGIQESDVKFKYFSWLSSDDFFYPNFLEMHFSAIEKSQSRISYSGYAEIVYDKNSQLLDMKQYRPVILEDINYPQYLSAPLVVERDVFRSSLAKNLHNGSCQYNGNCFVFEKLIFEEIGLFNQDYKFVQDFSMWLSISNNINIKSISLLPQILMARREHSGRTQYLYSQEDFIKQKNWEMSDMFAKFINN